MVYFLDTFIFVQGYFLLIIISSIDIVTKKHNAIANKEGKINLLIFVNGNGITPKWDLADIG
jgi:hypothetical protein